MSANGYEWIRMDTNGYAPAIAMLISNPLRMSKPTSFPAL
jgi:hypothetical protein